MPQINVRAMRYAQAAFGVAESEERLDDWLGWLDRAAELFTNREAEQYLTSPVVPPNRKAEALAELLPELPTTVRNFLDLLARRDRLELVPEVTAQFHRLMNERRGIAIATITSAVPLDAGQQEQIAAQLADRLGKQVVLEAHVDPSLIGGVVAQIGDDVIDGSVRGRLERLRQSLMA